jgi:plastocyanin
MNKSLILTVIIISLIGYGSALDVQNDLELPPGEAMTEYGIDHSRLVDNTPPSSELDLINTVNIKDNSFQPSTLTVPAGTTVTWLNQDKGQHTVSSDTQGLFESGSIAPGKKYTFNFRTPGSYKYHCNIHPGMQGTIIVSATAVKKVSGSTETKVVSLPSIIRGSDQGSPQVGRGEAASASWIEKPLEPGDQMAPPGMAYSGEQGAPDSTSLPLISNKAIDKSGGQTFSQSALQQFSQYYRSTPKAPKDQLTAPTRIELKGEEPAMLYFGSTQKAVPYTQYQTYALTTGLNSLWIQGATSWTQYAVVPLGSMLTMITMSPSGGDGYLYEVYPDGTLEKNSYYFYPYNQLGFYADQVGEHQLFFNIAGQPSNVIVVNVVPTGQLCGRHN